MKKIRIMLFAFICLFALGIYNVDASVMVGDTDITTKEDSSITIGEGTATWDAKNKTLTLKDVNVSGETSANGIIQLLEGNGTTLVLEGKNTITNTGSLYGIYANGNFTIEGTGTLTIVTNCQTTMRVTGDLVINGATLNLTASTGTSSTQGALEVDNNLTIKNKSNITIKSYVSAIATYSSLTVEDSTIDVEAGKPNGYSAIVVYKTNGEGSATITNSTVTTKGSTLAGIQVLKDLTITGSTIKCSEGFFGLLSGMDYSTINGKVSLKDSTLSTDKLDVTGIHAVAISVDNTKLNLIGNWSTAFNVDPTFTNMDKYTILVSENADGSEASVVKTTTGLSNYAAVRVGTAYTIEAEKDANSNVTLSQAIAIEGDTVEATITTTEGYKVDKVLVNDKTVEVKNNKVTFEVTQDTKVVVSTKAVETVIDVPSIDTSKEVKEVTIGVKTDSNTDATFKKALEDKNINITDADTIIDVAVKNVEAEDVEEETASSIAALIDKKNMVLASYFDITINVESNGSVVDTLTELNNALTFQVALPTDLINTNKNIKRTYYVIRYHDGKAEVLNTSLSSNVLTFASDKFSTYAIAYTDEAVKDTSKATSNPDTGDNVITYALTSVLCVSGLLGTGVILRKRFN